MAMTCRQRHFVLRGQWTSESARAVRDLLRHPDLVHIGIEGPWMVFTVETGGAPAPGWEACGERA